MHPKKIKLFADIHLEDTLPARVGEENHRFFANVHLDSELNASSLEGVNIAPTAAFLSQMMAAFILEEKIEFNPELKKAFTELQETPLAISEENFKTLQSLYDHPYTETYSDEKKYFPPESDPEGVRKCLMDYFKENIHYSALAEKIRKLDEGESLTIPGGYTAVVSGGVAHSVIYRFKKTNKQILIEVFNTGAGVTRHFTAETQAPDYYQTEACYRVSDTKKLEEILTSMGLVTVIPKLPRATDSLALKEAFSCDMDVVYDALEKNAERMSLKDEALVSKSYVGQQSGTCSVRVFTPLLCKLLPDETIRNRFKLYYKYHSILNFYRELKSDPDSTADDWELLSLATTKLMRVMRKKINREQFAGESVSKKLATLFEINREARKRILSAKRMATPITEEKESPFWLLRYEEKVFQESKQSKELKAPLDDLSTQALSAWIEKNQEKKQIKVMVLYEKIKQILLTPQYDPFQKRLAIGALINLLKKNTVQFDTTDIDNHKKLIDFIRETEKITHALVRGGLHQDIVTVNDIRLTGTLSSLLRKASQTATGSSDLEMLWPEEGLYETTANTAAFLEKIEDKSRFSAEDYKCERRRDEFESETLKNESIDELLKNKTFLALHQKVASKMNPKQCLAKLFEIAEAGPFYYKRYAPFVEEEIQAFVEFVENESVFGIISRGGNLLQQLGGFDKNLNCRTITCCDYYQFDHSIRLNFDFDSFKAHWINTKSKEKRISFLQQSQIAMPGGFKEDLASKEMDLLAQLAYTLKYFHKLEKAPIQESMYRSEHSMIEAFIRDKNQPSETATFALGFLNRSFYHVLDYFSRNPAKLTDYFHQAAFMMGLFGGGGKDLRQLDETHFSLLQMILDYHIKLYIKDRQTQQGLFLLEFFIQCRETGLIHPWLNDKFEKLMPLVMESSAHESHLTQKRLFAAQLIEGIRHFNLKMASDEINKEELIKSFCNLIALNKKQKMQSLQNNYRTFIIADTKYFDLMMKHHALLRDHPDLLIQALYPERSVHDQKKIAITLVWETFPLLTLVVDGEPMSFNLAKGEMSNKEGWIELKSIPDGYDTSLLGAEYHHHSLIENLNKHPKASYHSVRVNGIETEVIVQVLNQQFHFQKDGEGKPTVFLKRNDKTPRIYQKIQRGCLYDGELGSILADNPDDTLWVNTQDDNQVLVLDKDYKTKFSLDRKHKKLTDLETGYQLLLKQELYKTHPLLYAQLEQFLGQNNFRVYQNKATELMKIEIPGYPFVFNRDESTSELLFSADQNLKLNKQKRLDFPGSMTLSDEKDNHYLLFPDLPYHAFTKEGYFIKAIPDYNLSTFGEIKAHSAAEFQQFKNQRHCFKIKVNAKGQPEPVSFEEKLYLCYYYLNNKSYDKAFASIQTLAKEETLVNRFSVLELLHRLIVESPKKRGLQSETPFTEGILAVKIRAILLAAKIKTTQKIAWPSKPADFTAFAKLKEVQLFFEKFPDSTCGVLINQYVRHISQGVYPESWRITDEELRILIDFDLSAKLNQNKQIFQWRGRSQLKAHKSSEADVLQATKFALSSSESLRDSDLFIARYQVYFNTDEKKRVMSQDTKITDDIALVKQKIAKEEKEKQQLIKSAQLLLEKETDFKDHLALQIRLLEKQNDTKERLIALCQELQERNPDIQQAIESKDMAALVFEDLIAAFLRDDKKEIAQKLGVPGDDPIIPSLFLILENALKQKVQLERLQKIQSFYQRLSKPPKDEELLEWMNALRDFDSEYKLTDKNRELLIFEYQEQKRLTAQQVSVIGSMLQPGKENSGVQFKMGGGKTSTLLPLLAMKNADGEALSMVIVPDALLAINEKQLDLLTSRLFSTKSQQLHFSRETIVTRDSLQRLLNTLKNTQKQHGYLVTSRETLQALELKYLELVSQKADPDCIQLLKTILLLFREQGKAIIDEVDSVLDIRKEFNYSCGDLTSLESIFITDTLDLYRALQHLPKRELSAETIEKRMVELIDQLKEEKGFISDLMKRLSSVDIRGYLLGALVNPDFLKTLSPLEKERLALFKHQFTTLLPATLLQELHVNYGASKRYAENMSEIPYGHKLYAIPYLYNNIPAEEAEFSSPYETLNLTIQMHLASPLNQPILAKMLNDFYVEHFNEILEEDLKETKAAKKFKAMTGLDLNTTYQTYIKEGNIQSFLTALESEENKLLAVKYYLLETTIAPSITYSPTILKANAISFVDQVKSSIGVSGTVQNHRTWHNRIKLDASLTPDTEARTLYYLIEKQGKISPYSKDKITRLDMKSALQPMLLNSHTRAIIDLGAFFTGISNAAVAETLKNLLPRKNKNIRYVLYYDESSHLQALSIADGKTLLLERTDADYLEQRLGCSADQRFTFYDQSHTTGSDIQQMPHANAVATISQKTRKRDLVQGIMRMRGFENQQTIEFFVGHNISQLKKVEDIIQFTEKNQKEELLEDHYRAACKKMTAMVRNCFMTILLKTPQEEKVFKLLKERFEWNMASPFAQFGAISSLQKVREVLENQMKNELAICKQRLQEYALLDKRIEIDEIMKSLAREMTEMIDSTVDFCKPQVESTTSAISEQVTVQTEQQTEQHMQEQQQLFDRRIRVNEETTWAWGFGVSSDRTTALNQFHPVFSKNIYLTSNYTYHDTLEETLILLYQRPTIYCLFSRDNITGDLSCLLLTAKEAEDCQNLAGCWDEKLASVGWPNKTYWLEMPSGEVVLKGNKPKEMKEDKNYQQMLAEIQFFHGDIDLLLKKEKPVWLDRLSQQEADEWMKTILANPFFRSKKEYYDRHQKEWQSQFRATPKDYKAIKKPFSVYHRSAVSETYFAIFLKQLDNLKNQGISESDIHEINDFFTKEVFPKKRRLHDQGTLLSILNLQEFSLDLIAKFLRYSDQQKLNKSGSTYLALQAFITHYLKVSHQTPELADYTMVDTQGFSKIGKYLPLSKTQYEQFAAYARSIEKKHALDGQYNCDLHEHKVTSERYLETFLMMVSKDAPVKTGDFIKHVARKLEEYGQTENPLYSKLEGVVTHYLQLFKETGDYKEIETSFVEGSEIEVAYREIIANYNKWLKTKDTLSTSQQIALLRELRNASDTFINDHLFVETDIGSEGPTYLAFLLTLRQEVHDHLNLLENMIYDRFMRESDAVLETKKEPLLDAEPVSSFEKWQKAIQLPPTTTSSQEYFYQSPRLLQKVGEAYQQWEKVEKSGDLIEQTHQLNALKNAVDLWLQSVEEPYDKSLSFRLPLMRALQRQVNHQLQQVEETIYTQFLQKKPVITPKPTSSYS